MFRYFQVNSEGIQRTCTWIQSPSNPLPSRLTHNIIDCFSFPFIHTYIHRGKCAHIYKLLYNLCTVIASISSLFSLVIMTSHSAVVVIFISVLSFSLLFYKWVCSGNTNERCPKMVSQMLSVAQYPEVNSEGNRQKSKYFMCMDVSLSKLRETVKDREAWHDTVHGVTGHWTWLGNWTTTLLTLFFALFSSYVECD